MGHKLNILPRQYDKTGWHQSSQFDVPSIQQIKVDGSGKGKSLNAIPSPLARMHLFETAFEMVFQDLINGTKLAGEAYNKLVSDCLDVFELIYHWDSHVADNKLLEIVLWDRESEIYNLKNSSNERHQLLSRTLESFLNSEPGFKNFETSLIIKYNGKVIAGTSPFSGFFTTPDDLSSLGLLKPLSQLGYFSRTIHFPERKSEIRKYIYDFFETNRFLREHSHTSAIRSFLEFYKNQGLIDGALQMELKPLVYGGIAISAFDQGILTAKSIGTQYFEKQIIRLNYRLNDECFSIPKTTNVERTYDYLLPLTVSFFEQFDGSNVEKIVSVTEIKQGTVEVSIRHNGKQIVKLYHEQPIHDTDGNIVDLYDENQIVFNLGIFPFLRVTNQDQLNGFNDFYRVMVTFEDLNNKYSNGDINLRFGMGKQLIEDGPIYKVSRIDRTIFEKDKTSTGSIYFGLNTSFDFIQVEFPPLSNGNLVRNIIVPKWKEKSIGGRQIDFAIDLGTTSTFVAYTDDINHQMQPKPLEFNEIELPVALLNKPKEKKGGFRWIDCFEQPTISLLKSIEIQKQEFVPSLIKRGEKYEFPIRTALYQRKAIEANQKSTLQNANISFVYQKKDVVNLGLVNQEFKTNLKWNIKTNRDFESSIEVFIEELFYLIRTKIILNDGDPRKSKICWFSPLSFTSASKRAYTELWQKYSKQVLKYSTDNIYNLTESEAPFYYLFKNATINNSKSVLTLDIGGGSTDIMLFSQNKPVLGTSVHFGANVIWGNGFSNFISEKSNGIYLALKNEITDNLKSTELKKVNEDYCSPENSFSGSDEIINFWIANDELTKILSKLKNGDFRLSYLLHLAALIYHTLKLLKARNQVPPTAIIFSGNGSKYIDLIHDQKCISRIWGYFLRKIFTPDCDDPQVVLPTENRKEATCYGGLFVPQTPSKFEVENYLGFETSGEKYLKYKDIEGDKDIIFKKTLASFKEFIEWFFEMNDAVGLNFRNQFGIDTKLSAVKKFILDKAEENLNLGFVKRLEIVDRDDLISDSIFYYPLIGLIFRINKLSPQEIEDFADKTTYYLNGPSADRELLAFPEVTTAKQDSIYMITVENDLRDLGIITIIESTSAHRRALAAYQGYIDPVCEYDSFPEPGQTIKILEPGKVKKEGDKWIVKEKIKIEFVQ